MATDRHIRAAKLDARLPEVISSFRARLTREAVSCAVDTLSQWVARAVEWYNATYGEIFLLNRHGELQSIPGATIPRSRRSTVVPRKTKCGRCMYRVIEERTGDLINNMSKLAHGGYKLHQKTQSKLAVPLFDQDGRNGEVIGVFNLEAKEPGAFFPHHVLDLQRNTTLLTVDLLVMREWYQSAPDNEPCWLWHPKAHGWSPGKLMERFCRAVVQAASREGERQPTCSIWNADPEWCWVLGTSGYDFEFIHTHALRSRQSAAGRVAFANGRGVLRGTSEQVGFAYRTKADRMGVRQAQMVSLRREPSVRGTLTYYTLDARTPLLTGARLEWLAEQAEEFLAAVNRQREAFAKAYIHGQLAKSASATPTPEGLRRALMTVLPFATDTIFISAEAAGKRLKAVGCSGSIMQEADSGIGEPGAAGSEPGRITEHCFQHPDDPVRLNFRDDFERYPHFPKPWPQHADETASGDLGPPDVRRLEVGVTEPTDGKPVGVIRLWGSARGRPFTEADGRLLQAIAGSAKCRSAFRNWVLKDQNKSVEPDVFIPPSDRLAKELREVIRHRFRAPVARGYVFVRCGVRYQEYACYPPHELPREEIAVGRDLGQTKRQKVEVMAWAGKDLIRARLAFDFRDSRLTQADQEVIEETSWKVVAAFLSSNYWEQYRSIFDESRNTFLGEYKKYVQGELKDYETRVRKQLGEGNNDACKEAAAPRLYLHDDQPPALNPDCYRPPDEDLRDYGVTIHASDSLIHIPLRKGNRDQATLVCELPDYVTDELRQAVADGMRLRELGADGLSGLAPEQRWELEHEATWRQLRLCVGRIAGAWARIVCPWLHENPR